ncbi:hypothetical protein BGW37DRAFT_406773, partial [Umbelopsis sp. PMI_123]
PTSGPQGFDYIYTHRSRRSTRPQLWKKLRQFGVDTARVLDISFPARNVLGLLLHEQYKFILLDVLRRCKTEQIKGFNPTDP